MLSQTMSKRAALYEYVSMVEPSLIKKFSEQVRGMLTYGSSPAYPLFWSGVDVRHGHRTGLRAPCSSMWARVSAPLLGTCSVAWSPYRQSLVSPCGAGAGDGR